MLNVYLLRHGETAYNADGNRYCGRTDICLTAKGIKQAEVAFNQLKDISPDAVYSSPLERARHTASIAAGGKPVETDHRLIEVDFGSWEGKTRDEFITERPDLWKSWIDDTANARAGGSGETGAEVVRRVDAFYNEMFETHPDGTILVVGHNGINRLYMAHKLGMNLKYYRRIVQENSSITLFELDNNREFFLKKLNAIT